MASTAWAGAVSSADERAEAPLPAGRCGGSTNYPPWPGLWAIESHPGIHGIGARGEEVLVVTGSRDQAERAFWWDDDLPHVRRWQEDESG